MAVVFSFDLSWLAAADLRRRGRAPLARGHEPPGRVGGCHRPRLITLALQLIVAATGPLTTRRGAHLLAALPNEVLLGHRRRRDADRSVVLSLAIVLLTATLAAPGMVPLPVGARPGARRQLGSGILALATSAPHAEVRRLPLGNPVRRCALAIPLFRRPVMSWLQDQAAAGARAGGGLFHLLFNVALAVVFIGLTALVARWRWSAGCADAAGGADRNARATSTRPALATPSLASCAAREARCTRPTSSRHAARHPCR